MLHGYYSYFDQLMNEVVSDVNVLGATVLNKSFRDIDSIEIVTV